jgi:hypothetical protein
LTTPLRIDRTRLSSAILAHLGATGSLRLSGAFMELWCGWNAPTEDLRSELEGHGVSIGAPGDQVGGWELRVGAREEQLRLL